MIVVTIPQDGSFKDSDPIVEQFFKRTIGQAWNERRAGQLMDACLAVSSLGNVIVTTFTAARVKQEIAKEGILPFSLVFAKNVNIIEWATKKFKKSEQVSEPIAPQLQEGVANTPERAKFEPIPLPALVLHCTFSTILILASIRVPKPQDAYPLLVGELAGNHGCHFPSPESYTDNFGKKFTRTRLMQWSQSVSVLG